MGPPAAVMNDRITGICTHLLQTPSGPVPTPMPFFGPVVEGLATGVLIGGVPAAVVGSVAYATPPHPPGIADAFASPNLQRATVLAGSTTVFFEGRLAARTGSSCSTCTGTGTLAGSAATVLIGG